VNLVRLSAKVLAVVCMALLSGVGALALYYSNLPSVLRQTAAGAFALISVALMVQGCRRRGPWRIFLLFFAAIFLWWWLTIPPSNTRNWQADVRVLPWAEINGSRVTVHNIRNCDYRTETDYTVRHYSRTFDLDRLRSPDLFLVYWGSPHIAHTMLSFGFDGGAHLCFSVETRKEVGERYSAIKGFFKQFELTYVVADERDLVRLRTNIRESGKGEDVYLYRLNAPREFTRKVLLALLKDVNSLKGHPEWYRALGSNCTTTIRRHTAPFNPDARFDWRIIANGHLDEMLYERGVLDQSLPFPELKRRSYINVRAHDIGTNGDFSRLIRVGLPGMTTR
jgi:hypothetical protein